MSRCPEESFEEKNVSKRLKFFIIFVHWPQNISASRQKHFIRVVKKAFYVSYGTFWVTLWGKRTYINLPFFRFRAKKFRTLGKESRRLSKLSLTIREKFFEVFMKKIHLPHDLCILSIKQINFCLKDFGRVVKLLQLQKNNLEEAVFWEIQKYLFRFIDFERSFIGLLTKKF